MNEEKKNQFFKQKLFDLKFKPKPPETTVEFYILGN